MKWEVSYPDTQGKSQVVGSFKTLREARYFASTLIDQKLPFEIVPFINDDYHPVITKVSGGRHEQVSNPVQRRVLR